jgi:signal transduction histidine kinase
MRPERRWVAACALLAVTAGGCAALNGHPSNRNVAPPAPERPQPDISAVTPALEMMHALPAADPARQAELFQSVKDAAAISPTTANKLRFALAVATPGHGGSDPVAAQRQLSELLATPETLLPVERLLAEVELQEVEQRLVLQEENKQLREDTARDAHDKLLAMTRRLSVESDENARLRKALDEAQAKLEAVTHIERSINDRGSNGSHLP